VMLCPPPEEAGSFSGLTGESNTSQSLRANAVSAAISTLGVGFKDNFYFDLICVTNSRIVFKTKPGFSEIIS